MPAVQICEGVYWVGVQDPDLRVFDIIMETKFGTSYGAYLVKGQDAAALIDTVKEEFCDEYLDNLRSVIDLSQIKYLLINHTEPDHSGSISKITELIPDLKIVGSGPALEFLREICHHSYNSQAIGKGMEIRLGGKTLRFLGAMLLHWPDNVYTYLQEDKILFSGDSFGSHYSDDRLFSDLIDFDIIPALKDYFDHIIGPFKPYVLRAVNRLARYEIEMICPGHGPIIRHDVERYIDLYRQWAQPLPPNKCPRIVIAYVSAYGYTKRLAQQIAQGIADHGNIEVQQYDLLETPENTIREEMMKADGILIGSPTINKDAPPPVWDLLNQLSPIECHGKKAAAFGSYGWSGEAVPNLESRLRMLRMRIMPGLRVRLNPDSDALKLARDFGRNFARAVSGEKEILEPSLEYQKMVNTNWNIPVRREDYIRSYANEDLIVYWNPARCTHDTNCFNSLGTVFNPEAQPWVRIDADEPEKIIKTINACPSGALKYSIPQGSRLYPDLNPGPGSMDIPEEK